MRKICTVAGCDRPVVGRGLCGPHYQRANRIGNAKESDPLRPRLPLTATTAERFWFYVNKTETCWLWTGAVSDQNYGAFWSGVRTMPAHRFSWELHVGPIPRGHQVDHLCHPADGSCVGDENCPHRPCVRPDHLKACTPRENTLRSTGPSAAQAQQTHCVNGHPFDDANTWHRKNKRRGRHCRVCDRERKMAKRHAVAS